MSPKIYHEFKRSSEIKLNELNVEFSSVMEGDFNQILRYIIKKMEIENRTSETDIEVAKDNINKYIVHLSGFRERRFGKKDIIKYKPLNESQDSLSPFWPIC